MLVQCVFGVVYVQVVEVVDYFVVFVGLWIGDDGLGEFVGFDGQFQQLYFWWCDGIGVVVVVGDVFGMYLLYVIDWFFGEWIVCVEQLVDLVDGFNLFGKW